jgi:hypothetical protein
MRTTHALRLVALLASALLLSMAHGAAVKGAQCLVLSIWTDVDMHDGMWYGAEWP